MEFGGFTLVDALFVAFVYYLFNLEIKPLPYFFSEMAPVCMGAIFGVFFGDVPTGLFLGGTLMFLYAANNTFGSNVVQDQNLASAIAIPIALKFGLDAGAALAIAVPFGVIGAPMDNLLRLCNGFWTPRAEKHIDELTPATAQKTFSKLRFDSFWGPMLLKIVLRFLPVFIVVFFFGNATGALVDMMPDRLLHAFSMLGNILPALGLILLLRFIGNVRLMPYFIIGWIAATYLGLGALPIFLIGCCFAYLHYQFVKESPEYNIKTAEGKGEDEEVESVKVPSPYKQGSRFNPRKNFLLLPFIEAWFFRSTQSLQYFFATGVMHLYMPFLRKMYNDGDTPERAEGLKAALHRANTTFISTMGADMFLYGAVISMEESIAAGEDVNPDSVVALKAGLMGPISGIADPIFWGTVSVLLRVMCAQFAVDGNPAWNIGPIIMGTMILVVGYITLDLGYRVGTGPLNRLLKSGKANLVLLVAGILGSILVGYMIPANSSFNLAITLGSGDNVKNLGDTLNAVFPDLTVFLYTLGVYAYLMKGGKYMRVLWITLGATLVLGLIGIV